LHELLYENFFDPDDKKSRTFVGKYPSVITRYVISFQLKSTLGDKQFAHYLATPMLLGDGRKVTISRELQIWVLPKQKETIAYSSNTKRHWFSKGIIS
jgi:hypothetical protein